MKRAAVGIFTLVLLASGCSLGPREDWAKAMRDARKVAERSGGAKVTQAVSLSVIETTIRQNPTPLVATSSGAADFKADDASLVGNTGRKVDFVYDDLRVYATRSKSSPGVKQRPWAEFDYKREPKPDIDDNDRRMAVGVAAISPVLAVEMLSGILTGSVKNAGTATKAGVQTSHYTARLAPDAAIIDIKDEKRKEGVTRMFQTLGVTQDDFPIDAWIDSQGLIRGLRFTMKQQKDRVNSFKMTVSWEFSDYAPANPIAIPPRSKTVRSSRFRDFVTEVIRSFS